MNSTQKVPLGPIEADPIDWYRGRDIPTEIAPLLLRSLDRAGVRLGAYDRRLIEWASWAWDQPTMVTVVSWIERARAAGHDAGVADGQALAAVAATEKEGDDR